MSDGRPDASRGAPDARGETSLTLYRHQPLPEATFTHLRYVVKRPFWQFFNRHFSVFTPDGGLAMHVHHPVLRWRDELVLYADESETRPLLRLKVRSLLSLSTSWAVTDALTGEPMGLLRKQFVQSLVRDTWDILDPEERPIGELIETGHSYWRRLFPFLTSHHEIRLGGRVVARIRQVFRFFVKEFELDLSPALGQIDTRFAIACTLLALMAEARREVR
jgi:hypothetical protein